MRPASCEGDLLRLLASMPFLDRLEMVAISGWSRGAVYKAVERMEAAGFAASIPHATDLVPPTRRFHLTAAGVGRLAEDGGVSVDGVLRSRPVSAEWRRIMLERLDAAASIYRLASAVSNAAHPIRFRWYRAMPMDAAIALPDGRVVAVVRQGLASDRTAFAKRLWRLWEGPLPGAVLMLMPDEARLRHARRLASGAPVISFLALERDAASAGTSAPVWRLPSGPAPVDLRTVFAHTRQRSAWPAEGRPVRVSPPEFLTLDGSEQHLPACLLPALLKPAEKRALDLLADWPWITPAHLGELLGVERSRLSQLLQRTAGLGLTVDAVVAGRRRLALADRGLAMLARRDRAAVGVTRQRWSAAPIDSDAPLTWRKRLRRKEQAAAQKHRAHRGRARFRCCAGPPGPRPALGDRPARPSAPCLTVLPVWRPASLGPPRCIRHPAQGRRHMALLPGVGTPRRAPRDHGGTDRAVPALLLLPPTRRRPRRAARRPHRLRLRPNGGPLPARGAGRDGTDQGQCSPVGLPQNRVGRTGAAGVGLAHARRTRAGRSIPAPLNGCGGASASGCRREQRLWSPMTVDALTLVFPISSLVISGRIETAQGLGEVEESGARPLALRIDHNRSEQRPILAILVPVLSRRGRR